jgi:esterase/lipase superfamily enzyme
MSKKASRLNRHLYGNSKPRSASSRKHHSTSDIKSAQACGFSPSRDCCEVDLHNLGLHEAKERIKSESMKASKESRTVLFIHGFNKGTAIRDFIRAGPLQQSLDAKEVNGVLYSKGDGATYFDPSTRGD